jgi:hypothetical protein
VDSRLREKLARRSCVTIRGTDADDRRSLE